MMNMTYAELLDVLSKSTPEQLNQSVTVLFDGEYIPAYIGVAIDDDRIEENHLVIAVE
jgi:hypothetical protein